MPRTTSAPTFEELYRSGVERVWRVVSRLGVPSAELEDAVQDVFIVAHRKLSQLRADVPAELWLTGIAVKVAHDYRRRVQRKPTEPLAPAVKVADGAAAPDEVAVKRDALAFALKLLEQLEPEQREVFVLAEFEQLSAPQIATATGAPVNTVYSRLRLARGRFNALLQERPA
ncbi:MAG: sigma-70 family RNA polymerase sigma factor [Archangium sp.]|nr:sigma-70 family RNA polymerase sigma factor [Archangium sp.]